MNKRIIYFIFIIIPILSNSQEIKREKYNITINNSNKLFESYNINNKSYIPINQLAYLFNNQNVIDNYQIDINFGKFTFFPLSFFARVDIKGNEFIQQHNLPVINYNNETLIPLHSFFYSLDSLKIYNVEIDGKKIILSKFQKIAQEKMDTIKSPAGYKIPKSVERPALEELLKEK